MIDIGCLWFPDKGIVVYLVAAVVSVVTQRISPLRDDTKKRLRGRLRQRLTVLFCLLNCRQY